MTSTLVVGATGTVGTALTHELARRGHRVAQATRQPQSANQVRLDLVTGEGRAAAMASVHRLFLMAPPGHVNQDQLLTPMIDLAVQHRARKVVLMTAMGADADPSGGLAKTEQHLRQSGLPFAIIRPNWFMQNFHTFWMGSILATGEVQLPVGEAKASFIDARDIGEVAASLLAGDTDERAAFDLTGPEALSHSEAAALISAASGRRIGFRDVPPESLRPALLQAGLSPAYADFLLTILGFLKAGYSERTTSHVQDILGRPARTFADYAREHAAQWRL